MRRTLGGRRRSGLTVLATGFGIVVLAANAAVVSAAPLGTRSQSLSGRITARLRIHAPAPVADTVSPGAPPSTAVQAREGGQAPKLNGTFSISGALRDAGSLVMQPPAPDAVSPAMTIDLRGARGSLRLSVAMNGKVAAPSRTSAAPKARWRITSGTGSYAHLHASGQATLSPRLILLGGVVSSE
jgi:hypothetical protein